MSEDQYTVRCEWDPDARVWVATSDDVPGLATGADTLDELIEKLKVVIPELLEANCLLQPDQQGDIPFAIMAEHHEKAQRAACWQRASLRRSKVVARSSVSVRVSGHGDHEIWYGPVTKRRFMVDARIRSRHWANHTLKQAGLPKAF